MPLQHPAEKTPRQFGVVGLVGGDSSEHLADVRILTTIVRHPRLKRGHGFADAPLEDPPVLNDPPEPSELFALGRPVSDSDVSL